jgi:hypothetical protein
MSGGLITWIAEQFKTCSDFLVLLLIRGTSRFESELTEEGRQEQRMWRDRRMRNLKGLALRARRRQQKAS